MRELVTINTNVEFYSKNKFEKLVHLVGFIIRIYHDARSSECQIPYPDCFCGGGHWPVRRLKPFVCIMPSSSYRIWSRWSRTCPSTARDTGQSGKEARRANDQGNGQCPKQAREKSQQLSWHSVVTTAWATATCTSRTGEAWCQHVSEGELGVQKVTLQLIGVACLCLAVEQDRKCMCTLRCVQIFASWTLLMVIPFSPL